MGYSNPYYIGRDGHERVRRDRTYTDRFTMDEMTLNGVLVSVDFDRTITVESGGGIAEPAYTDVTADDVDPGTIRIDAGYGTPGRTPTADELPLVLAALADYCEKVEFAA